MIGFDVVCKDFKVGTTYYEEVFGNRCEFLVTEVPIVIGNQVSWKAINYNGAEVSFLITKGLEHYGPKLYWNSYP